MSTTLTTTTTLTGDTIHVGQSVPPLTDHAISVSLPTWKDVVGYEEGDKRVSDAMVNGYPRFFIHFSIQKVSPITQCKHTQLIDECYVVIPDMSPEIWHHRRIMPPPPHQKNSRTLPFIHPLPLFPLFPTRTLNRIPNMPRR